MNLKYGDKTFRYIVSPNMRPVRKIAAQKSIRFLCGLLPHFTMLVMKSDQVGPRHALFCFKG